MTIQTGTRVWWGGSTGNEPDAYLDIEGFEYTLKDWMMDDAITDEEMMRYLNDESGAATLAASLTALAALLSF